MIRKTRLFPNRVNILFDMLPAVLSYMHDSWIRKGVLVIS